MNPMVVIRVTQIPSETRKQPYPYIPMANVENVSEGHLGITE